MIDGASEIDHLAIYLDVHCVQVLASLLRAQHGTDPLTLDVDAALEAHPSCPVATVEADMTHDYKTGDLERGIEVPKGDGGFAWARRPSALTAPFQ